MGVQGEEVCIPTLTHGRMLTSSVDMRQHSRTLEVFELEGSSVSVCKLLYMYSSIMQFFFYNIFYLTDGYFVECINTI